MLLDQKGIQGQQVQQVQRAIQGQLVKQVLQDQKAIQAQLVQQELLDLQA